MLIVVFWRAHARGLSLQWAGASSHLTLASPSSTACQYKSVKENMDLVKNRTLHPHLRDDEALVVENAIRLAIDSVINVLYGVNSSKNYEYERMVADRDKEIQRLECRLTEMEHELQVLRRQGCTCGLFKNEHSLGRSRSSGDRQKGDQSDCDPGCVDTELTAEQQDCETSLSCK